MGAFLRDSEGGSILYLINWQQWQNKKIGSKPSSINVFNVFYSDSILSTKKDLFCVIISLSEKIITEWRSFLRI